MHVAKAALADAFYRPKKMHPQVLWMHTTSTKPSQLPFPADAKAPTHFSSRQNACHTVLKRHHALACVPARVCQHVCDGAAKHRAPLVSLPLLVFAPVIRWAICLSAMWSCQTCHRSSLANTWKKNTKLCQDVFAFFADPMVTTVKNVLVVGTIGLLICDTC